uniref:Uncharacterized protein n=1 Tax=Arundo donax TaxID=35708 RepID=A0A0A8ZBI7_ARUDO
MIPLHNQFQASGYIVSCLSQFNNDRSTSYLQV